MPATSVYVGLLLATAGWIAFQPKWGQRFIHLNSSNVHNLALGRWWTLFTSGLVVDGVPVLLGVGAVAAVLGLAEWRWGTWRAFGVFLFGHVVTTLLTEAAVWLMMLAHLSGSLPVARDIGISYGLAATASCLLALGTRRARRHGLPALAVLLTIAWYINQELADAGHLLAVGLGALGARTPWLRSAAQRRSKQQRPSPPPPGGTPPTVHRPGGMEREGS
ncbi:rhomboid-like protein [Streptomyces rimosus]|uniref:rhomboid-like protein n=1 Tax=Streptomyces rimosus TaxID=1927 RepID=UPI0018FE4357|nr:rhomboid-like protein [Streptomyces rimosus]